MKNQKSHPERTVSDFFDNELRDYALYTVENRAIPSLIDGFKPSQRKTNSLKQNQYFKNNI